jgi:hypothetical protein
LPSSSPFSLLPENRNVYYDTCADHPFRRCAWDYV